MVTHSSSHETLPHPSIGSILQPPSAHARRDPADARYMLQFATRAPLVTRVLVIQVLLVLALSTWLVMQSRQEGSDAITVATAVSEPVAATPTPAAVPVVKPMRINLVRGTVGPIRVGMTTAQASARLHEQLVVVQAATARTARFEAVAPKAGLTVSGLRGTIDTITITNAGAAAQWKTIEGLRIGSRGVAVTRTFPRAQRICGHEWWVEHPGGRIVTRFAGRGTVTAITVTKAELPLYVPCS